MRTGSEIYVLWAVQALVFIGVFSYACHAYTVFRDELAATKNRISQLEYNLILTLPCVTCGGNPCACWATAQTPPLLHPPVWPVEEDDFEDNDTTPVDPTAAIESLQKMCKELA